MVSRTLDPDDLSTFINGRLGERFIANVAQVQRVVLLHDDRTDRYTLPATLNLAFVGPAEIDRRMRRRCAM